MDGHIYFDLNLMHQITQIAEVIYLAASVLTSLPLIRQFLPVKGLGFHMCDLQSYIHVSNITSAEDLAQYSAMGLEVSLLPY